MFLDVDGVRMQVVSFGAGPRTLLAHGGWVGSWELWQQPFELLSPTWHCVGYDHRGSGETRVPAQSITPRALVDDLFRVMDRMEIERCVVAGESLGATVVLQAAYEAPERFEGLVLVDGSPAVTKPAVGPLIAGSRTDYAATVTGFVTACVPSPGDGHLRRWGRHLLMRAEPEAAARLLESYLDPTAFQTPLDQVTTPALVIHSADDTVVPVAVGEWMAATLPDATFVKLDGGGHVPTVTRPHEVAEAINTRFAT